MTDAVWVEGDDRPLQTIARNIATRYALVGVEMIIGLLTLPFNLHHLGPQAYGLLTLTAGITNSSRFFALIWLSNWPLHCT